MDLAVVIPFHHRRALLDRCLASVRGARVYVVDDSEGGQLAWGIEGVSVVRTAGEVGFARAANLGLSTAEAGGADLVLLLNDDAALAPGCLQALKGAWGADVGAVGPLLLDPRGQVESAGIELSRWGRLRTRTHAEEGEPREVEALSGACLLMEARRRFDPRYRHGMEDIALCRDLGAEGLRILLAPSARCLHEGGASVSRMGRPAQRHAVSGHLRLVEGGWRTPLVVGLALAQILRERGPAGRLIGVAEGLRDWVREGPG